MKEIFKIKTNFHQQNRQKEADLLRQFKNRSREERERHKKQAELEQTFNIWERKFKSMSQPRKET